MKIISKTWNAGIAVICILVLSGCSQQMVTFDSISYGTSFGHCLGYCATSTLVANSTLTVKKISRGAEADTISNSSDLSDEQLRAILRSIDYEQFLELPETIGCPDCADGGAEWLELVRAGQTKRVTFEYGETIQPIKGAVDQLRKLTEQNSPQIPE